MSGPVDGLGDLDAFGLLAAGQFVERQVRLMTISSVIAVVGVSVELAQRSYCWWDGLGSAMADRKVVWPVGCWRDGPVQRWSGLFDCCRDGSTTRPVPHVQTPCPNPAPGPCVQTTCSDPVLLVRGCWRAVSCYGAPALRRS